MQSITKVLQSIQSEELFLKKEEIFSYECLFVQCKFLRDIDPHAFYKFFQKIYFLKYEDPRKGFFTFLTTSTSL